MLEVIALNVEDARRAEGGGADQLELVGTMEQDGLSPSPELLADVTQAVNIPVRPMVRLGAGFSTDAAEIARLKELLHSYASSGAAGVVLGYLTPEGGIDVEALATILGFDSEKSVDFTFHRAIDHAKPGGWEQLLSLAKSPRYVLTAGSSQGVGEGLDVLVARAQTDPGKILAGGGLREEYVALLQAAGVRNFHIGSAARHNKSFDEPVDSAAVARWAELTRTEPDRA